MHKAAFLTGIKEIKVYSTEGQEFDGLKLKVDSCALCGSDIRIFNKGNDRISYPAIIGHEVSGTVTETNTSKFKVGDTISIGADIPCGKCNHCLANKPNLCQQNLAIGYQLEGGFSEYMYLSKELVKNGPIKKIPKEFNIELACLGEPLACAINGLEKLNMKSDSGGRMIIFGAGPIGIMLGMLAKNYYGVDQVDFVEFSQYRLDFLKKIGLADNLYLPDYIEENKDKFYSSYQYVITACSAIKTHTLGISLLANGGAINFFGGLPKPAPSVPIVTNDIHYKELTITGSHGSTPIQHSKAIDIILEKPEFFKSLITHRFKLNDISQAFKLASKGEGIKILIKP
jgi:L-iditol 2-dehydrogenase